MKRLTLAVFAICFAVPVHAGQKFEAYEGRDVIQEGEGGSRVTKHGIDYWTNGAPPRRYQLIGFLTDKRRSAPLHGDAVGSKGIAKAVIAAGGNAVILTGREERLKGVVHSATVNNDGTSGYGFSKPTTDEISRFAVIKYLD